MITGQTQGIVDDISKRFPEKKVVWLPNGVDLSYYNPAEIETIGYRKRNGLKESDILFFYGGVVGYAQGLDVILNAAKLVENRPEIQFIIQGAGPEKERLLQLKEELNVTNVHFLPPVDKSEMPGVLKEINVAVIPLRKLRERSHQKCLKHWQWKFRFFWV